MTLKTYATIIAGLTVLQDLLTEGENLTNLKSALEELKILKNENVIQIK